MSVISCFRQDNMLDWKTIPLNSDLRGKCTDILAPNCATRYELSSTFAKVINCTRGKRDVYISVTHRSVLPGDG